MSKNAQDSIAHCNNARKILHAMNATLAKAQGYPDARAYELIADTYIAKSLNLNQNQVQKMSPPEYKAKSQEALHTCVHQLYAVNEVGIDTKKDKGSDFMQMAHTQRMVTKIQAKFRQLLVMKKMQKDIDVQKAKLDKKTNQPLCSNEELALREFKQRLSKKGLTPEAFFRCCDPSYSKRVKVEDFKTMLMNFKLNLRRGEVQRLVLILDEDMEGTISIEEYYNALEAYGIESEKHYPTDGTDYYQPFTHRAMFKLIMILKDRGISVQELYRSIDVNNDGDVNLRELESVLTGFSAEFYQKDTQAIHQFLDIDKNDICTDKEFYSQMEKAERLFQAHKDRLAGKSRTGKSLRATQDFGDGDASGMNAYIPGYTQSSQEMRSEKMTDFLMTTFKSRDQPSRIYSMADKHGNQQVKFATILEYMGKYFPSMTPDFLDNVPSAYQMNKSDILSKQDWELLFNQQARMASSVGVKPSATKMRNTQKKRESQDNDGLLKYLAECLQKEGLTPIRLFKRADKNFNQVLSVDELKEAIKELMPDRFAGLNFKKLLNAFDANQNGYIEQDEFLDLMDRAMTSGASTSQYKKVAEATSGGGKGTSAKPKMQADTLKYIDTVHAKDRMTSQQVIDWLNRLIEIDNHLNVDSHVDTFQAICEKIQKWKEREGQGNSEMIEDLLKNELKPVSPVNIHNVKTINEVLKRIQKKIGLTDVEIILIIFTSLDQDYMTNLIIKNAEFLQWFSIEFDGNSDEEAEFLENLCDNWASTTTLAMEITGAYGCLQENHECILTEEWWEKLRYLSFGQQLKERFDSNPKFKTQVKDMFKKYQNNLNYFDFFNFIEGTMGINDLEKWEKDSLECRLDKLNFAFIEFNEFNEFCDGYKINLGERILDNDLESQIEEKMNVSYKNYIVGENDYFRGVKTMLNNEKAALATVSKIYRNLKQSNDRGFKDPDFGPKLSDGPNPFDIEGNQPGNKPENMKYCWNMYVNGHPPEKGYPMPADIEWKSIKDIAARKQGRRAKFINNGISATDVVQGELGDCWLISGMASLAARDNLLVGGIENMDYDNMIVDKSIAKSCSEGVFPPIFHRYRSRGLYVIRIFKDFKWVYVIIDDTLPCNKNTGLPVFGRCKTDEEATSKDPLEPSAINPSEFWVSLIEKAYAKMHGCYGNLISGYIDEAVQELTGFQPEKILIRDDRTGVFPHKMVRDNYTFGNVNKPEDGFWNFLMERFRDRCIMGCSVKGNGKSGELILDGNPTGLMLNHAYSLMFVWEIAGGVQKNDIQRIVVLRNPWGHGEWKGAWSDGSDEFKKYKPQILENILELDVEEQFGPAKKDANRDDGIFLMHYDDWRENFSTLFINIDFPEDWTGLRWASEWNSQNAAGLPPKYDTAHRQAYANNPQFLLTPEKDCEIVISLAQLGGRLPEELPGGKQKYYEYPFAETLRYACLAIFQLDRGQKILTDFDQKKIVYLSPIKRERENSGRCQLKGGTSYIAVPATECPQKFGKFYVSLYHNLLMRDFEAKRVFKNPSEATRSTDKVNPLAIPEEAEKSGSVVPVWKLEMIRKQIRFFMTDDDQVVANSDVED